MAHVLVGIPTYRRADLLLECLASIAGQVGNLPTIRVLVADNDRFASAGAKLAAELSDHFPYELASAIVAEPGISAVRNAILAEARQQGADFIAMIDDDETATSEWLAELLRAQATYQADVVGGPVMRDMPVSLPPWLRAGIFRVPYSVDGCVPSVEGTGNVLISTTMLAQLGWPQFDLAFGLTGGEDYEWFTRLKGRGATFAWASKAIAHEPVAIERTKLTWLLKRSYRSGMTHMRVTMLHDAKTEVAALALKAFALVALTPILGAALIWESLRLPILARWSRAAGRLGALFGSSFQEYSKRHEGRE